MNKLNKYFNVGNGKKLSVEEASEILKIKPNKLAILTFHYGIPYHVAGGEIYFIKHELARWKMGNPTVLLSLRRSNQNQKRGAI